MSFPKVFFVSSIIICLAFGSFALFKKEKKIAKSNSFEEVVIDKSVEGASNVSESNGKKTSSSKNIKNIVDFNYNNVTKQEIEQGECSNKKCSEVDCNITEVNCIDKLFVIDSTKLPIVETITYTSRVPWLKDRPAWLSDYASHFETSRHFIARSLNKRVDYFTQKVSPGDKFNVLKKNVQFHLLVDLSSCKLWFYAIDTLNDKRFLLKTYRVGLGRKDSSKPSGYLTPIGRYTIGSKVAIYKSGTMGYFQDRKIEMIRIFGTRWIPFDKELENCSERASGYGIHGAPWIKDEKNDILVEDFNKIGSYESDGCIRLLASDIEEIFAIVISKPTVVEIVKKLTSE